jgi:hypothetical protein
MLEVVKWIARGQTALQEIYYRQSVTQHHNRGRLGNDTDHTVENVEHASIFG